MRVVAAVLAVWTATSAVAFAQAPALDDERARGHYIAGESHFAAEHWDDAAREFEQAYALSQRPEMLINLSRAHERGGSFAAGIADLELLLQRYPDTAYRLEAEKRIEVMRAKLAAVPPPVVAEPEPVAPPPPAPPVKIWPPHLPTLIVGSVAIAAGVVSLGTGLRAHNLHNRLEDRCLSGVCNPGFEDARDTGRTMARTSTALMFTAIGLAGATAALWIIDYKRDKRMQLGFNGSSVKLHLQF